ncbi:MAG: gluconate 2-dehydrogenase subunit 3 family protein [Ginsengibacter sp.]|nr:gluconate 2-dehydrogenase subunit 3 family protein [Hanamia sp.]
MNRREAVQYISLIVGGTIVGSSAFLAGCTNSTKTSMTFSDADVSLLDEVADTILPTTKTPGAKAAKVGQFMTVMVNDCYEAPDQKIFHEGLGKLNDESNKKYSKDFMKLSSQQKHDLLVSLDKASADFQKKVNAEYAALPDEKKTQLTLQKNFEGEDPWADKRRADPNYYYAMMKQLTLLGYFTSEIGCTKARRYVETPGHYDGDLPYKKGDKAFA